MSDQASEGSTGASGREPLCRPLGFVSSLEGLRALAVVFVIAYHFSHAFGGGFIGVDVFFVLSGFLITTLLFEEHHDTGRISLKAFYRRRMVRLGPALLAVVVIDAVVRGLMLGAGSVPASAVVGIKSVSFLSNWLFMDGQPTHELGPTWSLAVEEQFYLVWSVALVALLGWGWSAARVGRRAAMFGFTIAAWCLAVYLISGDWTHAIYGSDTRSAGLFLGAALACARRSGATARFSPATIRWSARGALVSLIIFVLIGSNERYIEGGGILMVMAAVVLVHAAVADHDPVLRWVLTRRPVLWTGRISYGLYLWNILVLTVVRSWWPGASEWSLALVGIPLSFVCAQASYLVVERPVARWARARSARRALVPARVDGMSEPSLVVPSIEVAAVEVAAVDVAPIDLRTGAAPVEEVGPIDLRERSVSVVERR